MVSAKKSEKLTRLLADKGLGWVRERCELTLSARPPSPVGSFLDCTAFCPPVAPPPLALRGADSGRLKLLQSMTKHSRLGHMLMTHAQKNTTCECECIKSLQALQAEMYDWHGTPTCLLGHFAVASCSHTAFFAPSRPPPTADIGTNAHTRTHRHTCRHLEVPSWRPNQQNLIAISLTVLGRSHDELKGSGSWCSNNSSSSGGI